MKGIKRGLVLIGISFTSAAICLHRYLPPRSTRTGQRVEMLHEIRYSRNEQWWPQKGTGRRRYRMNGSQYDGGAFHQRISQSSRKTSQGELGTQLHPSVIVRNTEARPFSTREKADQLVEDVGSPSSVDEQDAQARHDCSLQQ